MRTFQEWCKDRQPMPEEDLLIASWGFGTALVWLRKSKGILRREWPPQSRAYPGSVSDDVFLMLGDVPLLHWQHYGCGTCPQLLQAGYVHEAEREKHVQAIESLRLADFQQSPQQWVNRLQPLLALLEPGFYRLKLLPCIPTDGEGRFFWSAYPPGERVEVLRKNADAREEDLQGKPVFLMPSQPTNKYEGWRLEHAQQTFRTHPGLVFHLHSGGGVLLDGHHRATAAALAKEPFICLTINDEQADWTLLSGGWDNPPYRYMADSLKEAERHKLRRCTNLLHKEKYDKPEPPFGTPYVPVEERLASFDIWRAEQLHRIAYELQLRRPLPEALAYRLEEQCRHYPRIRGGLPAWEEMDQRFREELHRPGTGTT